MSDLVRNGVTFAEAYLEAASIAPDGRAALDMIEIFPPDGRPPFRIVNNYTPIFATLEDDAAVDGGVEVEWLACPCRLKPMEESDAASTPQSTIEVDNLAVAINRVLRECRGIQAPWIITNRKYLSDNLSAPCQLPPVTLELVSVSTDGPVTMLTAEFGDAGNVGYPGLTFQRNQYTTLDP